MSLSTGLASMNTSDLGLTDTELSRYFALRHHAFELPNFLNLGVAKFYVRSLLACVLNTSARAVTIAVVILSLWRELFTASRTRLGWVGSSALKDRVFRHMKQGMSPGCLEFQVFDPVVMYVAVLVMNYLIGFQRPTEIVTHHQSVLQDVTGDLPGIGMIGCFNHDVPARGKGSAAFPFRVSFPYERMTWQPSYWLSLLQSPIRRLTDTFDALTASAPALYIYIIILAHVGHYNIHGNTCAIENRPCF